MTTALFTHSACLDHDPGFGHPERPDRLRAVLKRLEHPDFTALDRRAAPIASRAALAEVHDLAYVEAVLAAIPQDAESRVQLDPDTAVSARSGEAAMRAAGAVCAAIDAVYRGDVSNAFCAVRPPGHHAEAARAMGFCLFNSVAVGAKHARAAYGVGRIAVVDFDVHHGNGTQEAAETDPDFFFGSIHQGGIYPGTGRADETGPAGNIVNAPVPSGTDGPAWRAVFSASILPALDAFAPEMILVSAGFDGHRADPLAGLALEAEDFAWATRALLEVARGRSKGRLVSTLEGGYDLGALGESAEAHVRALMAA